MPGLLALDLDGTLLDRSGNVAGRDRAAIAALRRSGVAVTIVTGRLSAGALAAARACDLVGAIGCCDGSHLYDVGQAATLAHHALPPDVRRELDRVLTQEGSLLRYVFSTSHVFFEDAGHPFADYVRTWSPEMAVLDDLGWQAAVWDDHAPLAQLAIGPAHTIARALAAVRALPALFSVSFAVAHQPHMHALLVRASGPSKGTALRALCAHYGVAPADSVAVGDWINDVPMFQVAGRSFAMAGAPAEVEAAATDRLPPGASIADAIALAWPELR